MTRTFDALEFDPAPGELGRVEASAEQYQRVSAQLGFARDAITSIIEQPGIWEGDASAAFARRVGDLPEYLDIATRAMSWAATALADWHTELTELQRRAWELELRAREARGEADVETVRESAERLNRQHDEAAHRIARLLDTARDLAPDEPGLFSRCLDTAEYALTTIGTEFAEAHSNAARTVGDVIEDNAHVIADASDVLADVSTVLSAAGDHLNVVPVLGHIGDHTATGGDMASSYDDLGQYWMPRDLRQGARFTLGAAGPVTVALENAISDGIADDNAIAEERV